MLVGIVFLSPIDAYADWCTSVSYSGGLAAHVGSSGGRQCGFPSQAACENARRQAAGGVSSSACYASGATGGGNNANWAQMQQQFAAEAAAAAAQARYQAALADERAAESKNTEEQSRAAKRTAEAKASYIAERDALAGSMQGDANPSTALRNDDGAVGGLKGEATSSSLLAPRLTSPKRNDAAWQQGFDCAMNDVYAGASAFGQAGAKFVAEIRKEVASLRKQSSAKAPLSGDANEADVTSLSVDRQFSVDQSGQKDDRQFIVKALVVRHGDGTVTVDVSSHIVGTDTKYSDERQSIIVFDGYGNIATQKDASGKSVTMAEMSPGVKRCLNHSVTAKR